MARRTTRWLAMVFLLGGSAHAQTVITVGKSGADVVLNITGTPTFSVYRATRPDFSFDGATLTTGLNALSYTDTGAVQATATLYCYDVAAVGESSPGQVAGGSPQPQVQITLLSPGSGKAGDSVMITGTGFGQFYSENLVTFNGKPATVTAVGAGTITVTVPAGGTSGSVQVRVGRLISNALSFTIAPADAFSILSGIGVNPANFKVFVIDTGASPVSSSLIELDPFAGWTKTTRGGNGNIRGFPYSPLNNRFYYSNASKSTANQGVVNYWDLGTSTQSAFPTNAGTATTDPVSCVAMAASPATTTDVFFADKRNQQIRRLGNVSSRTVYSSGFSFLDSDYNSLNVAGFAGLAFDNNGVGTNGFGDLFVGDNTSVWKVVQTDPINTPDATTKTQVFTGLVSVAGLTFDTIGTSEYQTRTLHIADRGGSSIWLYSAVTGTADLRLTGLNQPRMVSLGQTNDTPPETRLYIAEPTRVVASADLRIDMTPADNIRAIISNCPAGNVTPGCLGAPYPSSFQTVPRQIAVTATIHPRRSGVTIYFDVEDPPDTAAYATGSSPGDNVGGPGALTAPFAITDSHGVATDTLIVTDTYSGDNYRVRARLASAGAVVAKTGVITAWKRVFAEMDRMYRAPGQYLTANSSAGATSIAVANTSRFSPGDTVDVFDAVNDIPEVRQIAAGGVGPTSITLTSSLSRSHLMSDSAYVGREADGFYSTDLSYAYAAFDDAFVEIVPRPDGAQPVPYTPETALQTGTDRHNFSTIWFKNGKQSENGTNYIHVIGCETFITGGSNTAAGISNANFNELYIAVKRIETLFSPNQPTLQNASRRAVEHEFGHQFGIAGDYIDPDPLVPAWCNPGVCSGILSIMDYRSDPTNAIDEFAGTELFSGASSIREVTDPI